MVLVARIPGNAVHIAMGIQPPASGLEMAVNTTGTPTDVHGLVMLFRPAVVASGVELFFFCLKTLYHCFPVASGGLCVFANAPDRTVCIGLAIQYVKRRLK